mmetsp:Transcript_111284/g.208665  ORF Transcript_111284/g.208665 Transcript_111284/m.208665 type:complete len:111 (-) Transcript_111284:75-407(-)
MMGVDSAEPSGFDSCERSSEQSDESGISADGKKMISWPSHTAIEWTSETTSEDSDDEDEWPDSGPMSAEDAELKRLQSLLLLGEPICKTSPSPLPVHPSVLKGAFMKMAL